MGDLACVLSLISSCPKLHEVRITRRLGGMNLWQSRGSQPLRSNSETRLYAYEKSVLGWNCKGQGEVYRVKGRSSARARGLLPRGGWCAGCVSVVG